MVECSVIDKKINQQEKEAPLGHTISPEGADKLKIQVAL